MSNIAGYGQRFIEKVPQATLILFPFVQFCLFCVTEEKYCMQRKIIQNIDSALLAPLVSL